MINCIEIDLYFHYCNNDVIKWYYVELKLPKSTQLYVTRACGSGLGSSIDLSVCSQTFFYRHVVCLKTSKNIARAYSVMVDIV